MEAGGMEDTPNECFAAREMLQITVGNNEAAKKPSKKGKETHSVKTARGQSNNNHNAMVDKLIEQARSKVTIYCNVVNKQGSSSSEDDMVSDNSGDSLNNVVDGLCISGKSPSNQHEGEVNEAMGLPPLDQLQVLSAKEKTDQIIKDAEAAKAKIFPPKGESMDNFEFVAEIDQDYLSVGSHVDQVTQEKIKRGEYVDFSNYYQKIRW